MVVINLVANDGSLGGEAFVVLVDQYAEVRASCLEAGAITVTIASRSFQLRITKHFLEAALFIDKKLFLSAIAVYRSRGLPKLEETPGFWTPGIDQTRGDIPPVGLSTP